MEENPVMAHKIVLNNRNLGNLTGILDVISFDENSIVLDTDMGLLTIKGKDLHVNRLLPGNRHKGTEGHTRRQPEKSHRNCGTGRNTDGKRRP